MKKYNNKLFQGVALVCLLFFMSSKNIGTFSQTIAQRKIVNINEGWQYLENGSTDIDVIEPQEDWIPINLPHTWNQWDAVDMLPGYRRDASWYRKEILIENYIDAQFVLYFEGSNITTQVYVNGEYAGGHVGGYVGFEVDISKRIKLGQNNTIHVRVDNSYNRDIIPSQKADFFIYGGITRDVWLKILPELNIKNVKISTPKVSDHSATTTIELEINNAELLNSNFTISSKIIDPVTKESVAELVIDGDEFYKKKTYTFPIINDPKLWSPENPNRYLLVTQILKEGKVVEEKSETFGYRWFEFEDYGAFYLNGKRLLLRGTHRHEEHAGYGAAMSNEMHYNDIAQMKEMGVNFLRLGHYAQDPEVYKACDELGIIVWDELPWCRGGIGESQWQENTKRLLKEQIRQNYNHPSVLFWSLGNEIYWLPDFENGDDEKRLNSFVKQLNTIAHDLDKSRFTSIRKYYAGSDLVDVFSPSIWSGWYAGVYTNYEKTLTENQNKYPKFLHMEYGGSSHVGRHTENPIMGNGEMNEDDWAEVANQVNIKNIAKSGDWTENYIVDLFDWYLGITETKDNFSGNAQWAFKDFGTPLRPENAIPYLNQKGLVDRSGKPKDAFYVFKSYWSKDLFTYIESHSWTERRGPQGKPRNLSVFSNCEKVELVLNGKSMGQKNREVGKFPACGLNWDVLFTKGANELVALGFKGQELVASDTMVVNYDYRQAEKADHIQLSYRVLPNHNYLIEATMLDKNNARVLDYEKPIYFSKDGSGELMKNYGTPTRSQIIQMANGYAAIELVPAQTGKTIVEARNQDFKGSYLVIDPIKVNSVISTN